MPPPPSHCHECGKPYPWTGWSLRKLWPEGRRREPPEGANLWDRTVHRAKDNWVVVALGLALAGFAAVKPVLEMVQGAAPQPAVDADAERFTRCRYVLVEPLAELDFGEGRLSVELKVNNVGSPSYAREFTKLVRPSDEGKADVITFKGFDSGSYMFEARVSRAGTDALPSHEGWTDITLGTSKFYVLDMRPDRRPPFEAYPVSDEAAMAFASRHGLTVPECQPLPAGLRW